MSRSCVIKSTQHAENWLKRAWIGSQSCCLDLSSKTKLMGRLRAQTCHRSLPCISHLLSTARILFLQNNRSLFPCDWLTRSQINLKSFGHLFWIFEPLSFMFVALRYREGDNVRRFATYLLLFEDLGREALDLVFRFYLSLNTSTTAQLWHFRRFTDEWRTTSNEYQTLISYQYLQFGVLNRF